MAYPPAEPPAGSHVLSVVRRYGLFALIALAVPVLALWMLTGSDAAPEFELTPEERAVLEGANGATAVAAPRDGFAALAGGTALSVYASPADASVRVDFDDLGRVPVQRMSVEPGTYLVSVARDGYITFDTLLTIGAGRRPVLRVALQPWGDGTPGDAPPWSEPVLTSPRGDERASARRESSTPAGGQTEAGVATRRGSLRVSSEPTAARVWLDGQAAGTTPLDLDGVAAGPHTVEVRTEDGRSGVREVTVEPGVTSTVELTLVKAVGTLTVMVRPWGSIYIDERMHRQDTDVQYQVQLPVGTHRVRVEHPVLGSRTREVQVQEGAPARIEFDLNERRPPPVEEQTASIRASGRAGGGVNTASTPEAPPATPPAATVYDRAEQAPALIGGIAELHRRARYPERAYRMGLEGRVVVRFVVDEEGRVLDPTVVRGIGMGCDEEALRVVREARFEPGRIDGKPVRVRHALAIQFRKAD